MLRNEHVLEQDQTDTDSSLKPQRKFKDLSRRDLRSLVFNLIYMMDSHEYDVSLESIVDNINRGFEWDIPLDDDVVVSAQAIINERNELDDMIKPLLHNWRFDRIGVCTKLILRLALWELKNKVADSTVLINEAVELAKNYAEKDSYKFINGLLDEFVKSQEKAA